MKRSGLTVWELRKPIVDAMYFSRKRNCNVCIIIKIYVLHSRLYELRYYFQGI